MMTMMTMMMMIGTCGVCSTAGPWQTPSMYLEILNAVSYLIMSQYVNGVCLLNMYIIKYSSYHVLNLSSYHIFILPSLHLLIFSSYHIFILWCSYDDSFSLRALFTDARVRVKGPNTLKKEKSIDVIFLGKCRTDCQIGKYLHLPIAVVEFKRIATEKSKSW